MNHLLMRTVGSKIYIIISQSNTNFWLLLIGSNILAVRERERDVDGKHKHEQSEHNTDCRPTKDQKG